MSGEEPEILWHYTNWSSLVSILTSKEIWASHVAYLNDVDELNVALVEIKRQIESFSKLDEDVRLMGMKVLEEMQLHPYFITSFCASSDLLSQWRGYTDGVTGIAIGFDKSILRGAIYTKDLERRKIDIQVRLLKCVYDEEWYRDIINRCAAHWANRGSRLNLAPTRQESLHQRADYFRQNLWFNIPKIKNKHFREENEWRFAVGPIMDSSLWGFHQSKSRLVPHVAISFHDDEGINSPIKKLLIGPNQNMKLAIQSAKMLLQKFGLSNVGVEGSEIPYRNW